MRSLSGLILTLILVLCIAGTGCTTEDTSPPAAPDGNIPQHGALIQTIGNVTGQGVILEGVPRGTIDTITFTIGLAPGVKTVDLTNMTIVYADAVRTEILTPVDGYRGDPPAGFWGIIDTVHELGDPNMRLDFEEQFVIRINPRAPVVPNQVITISVKPREGKPLVLRRIAPSTILADNNLPGL